MPNDSNRVCGRITERYCAEIGENVVLRSTSPENDEYECLNAPFCTSKKKCPRKKHTENDI